MTPDGKLGTAFFHLSSRRVDRCRPGRRAKPLSNWAGKSELHKLGRLSTWKCARAAGIGEPRAA